MGTEESKKSGANMFKITVLVAARNEENNIEECLSSLLDQDYPKEYYTILVGDDCSEDATAAIVESMEKKYSIVRLHRIVKKITNLRGKANVLAQLAQIAEGDIFLITDADIQVHGRWISSMVSHFAESSDLVSGTVAVNDISFFAKLQNADWIHYMAQCGMKSEKGRSVTAIGCNMAIKSSVYKAVGGYENIPFSITEDYELFSAVVASGYKARNIFEKDVLAFTHPVRNIAALFRQRRRWLTGSFRKSRAFVVNFNLTCIFMPFLILLSFFVSPLIPLAIFLFKWAKDVLFLSRAYDKIGLKVNSGIFFYTPYIAACNSVYFFFQFLPTPVEWKGRKYES